MNKLTENIVMQRVRSSSTEFDKICQLNITGRGLADISLLKRLVRLQVLSLSVNNITTLADLENCKRLKTLHLRQNKIASLDEIKYLMNLPALETLSLSENPCAKDANYRLTVIKNLRHLLELDGTPVTVDERKDAMKYGKDITPKINPLRNLENYIPDGPQLERSPPHSPIKPYRSETDTKNVELEVESQDLAKGPTKNREPYQKQPNGESVDGGETEPNGRTESRPQTPVEDLACQGCKCAINESDPLIKTSNILSATLFLINELDYPSLQIVQSQIAALLNPLRVTCHLHPKLQNCISKY